jgi:hypothetical protein
MNAFNNFISKYTPALPLLPLAHNCTGQSFKSILSTNKLEAQPCTVYTGEDLVYFFYGRPAYRVEPNRKANSHYDCFPVAIVVQPDVIATAKRVAPFDTGAFHKSMFSDFIQTTMKCDDFLVTPTIDSAAKIISAFYGNNKAYLLDKKLSVPASSSPGEAHCYYSMGANTDETEYDERRNSIEIQTDNAVNLVPGAVKLVVLPGSWLDDKVIAEKLVKGWKAQVQTYFTLHSRPIEYIGAIREHVYSFYKNEGIL